MSDADRTAPRQWVTRRAVVRTAVAAAALGAVPRSFAQSPVPGDWFAMVKSQHESILNTLERIVTVAAAPGGPRAAALKQLSYLLTAHSVAEENILYPALGMHGFTLASGDLYLEQQLQKVWNREIDVAAMNDASGSAWLDKVKNLQAALTEHAREHEEANYYPKLQGALSPAENAALTYAYQMEYSSVMAPPA